MHMHSLNMPSFLRQPLSLSHAAQDSLCTLHSSRSFNILIVSKPMSPSKHSQVFLYALYSMVLSGACYRVV